MRRSASSLRLSGRISGVVAISPSDVGEIVARVLGSSCRTRDALLERYIFVALCTVYAESRPLQWLGRGRRSCRGEARNRPHRHEPLRLVSRLNSGRAWQL